MIFTAFDGDNTILERIHKGDEKEEGEDPAGTAISALEAEGRNGNPCLILCFKMTEKELQEIIRTGRVWMIVHALQFPMVELRGERPF